MDNYCKPRVLHECPAWIEKAEDIDADEPGHYSQGCSSRLHPNDRGIAYESDEGIDCVACTCNGIIADCDIIKNKEADNG